MSRQDAANQYATALEQGRSFYRTVVNRGEHPYPPVLDEMVEEASLSGRLKLGLVNVPSELIVGMKSEGRKSAFAGNFMPLLDENSEFGVKWINLCEAHLSDEGIRDPITCFEYMGRFYVQEGNKRVSVLKSYGAASIPANVTRLIPEYSDDHETQVYYEFMRFYHLAGLYGVEFKHRGQYAKLHKALGFAEDHVWSEMERRSFAAGFRHFCNAFDRVAVDKKDILPAEALLSMLELYSFREIKEQSVAEIGKNLAAIWPDVRAQSHKSDLSVSTQPERPEQGLLTKLFGVGKLSHIRVAFVYAHTPDVGSWTKSHDLGRAFMEKRLEGRAEVKTYIAKDKEYLKAMEEAVADGAQIIFATIPSMMDACRRIAAEHPEIMLFNCALHRHYAGVRTYYSRIYEAKFITGAIAGAMTGSKKIGYVANYPIFGASASINAFALGVRMTNPNARIKLLWSCIDGDPIREFTDDGITVISNQDLVTATLPHHSLDFGTYKLLPDGKLLPLAAPCWDWGRFYEKVVAGAMNGAFTNNHPDRSINYWWGMDSRVINVQLSQELPEGVRTLAEILIDGIKKGEISPFRSRIFDQEGILRCDGENEPGAETLMEMDWLCENVDGGFPEMDQILPYSSDMVRLLGLPRLLQTEEKGAEK